MLDAELAAAAKTCPEMVRSCGLVRRRPRTACAAGSNLPVACCLVAVPGHRHSLSVLSSVRAPDLVRISRCRARESGARGPDGFSRSVAVGGYSCGLWVRPPGPPSLLGLPSGIGEAPLLRLIGSIPNASRRSNPQGVSRRGAARGDLGMEDRGQGTTYNDLACAREDFAFRG